MSLLTVVRHGQASFFATNYDQLSPLGEQQAKCLGNHWAQQRLVFDEIYTGPRIRQQKTAELAGSVYQELGLEWPDPIVIEDLDEYDLDGLSNRLAPQLAEHNSEFARLVQNYMTSEGEQNRLRGFQRMFETLLGHWQTSETSNETVESWPSFRSRVQRVIRRIQDRPGRSRRIAVFTSGGFIGTTVQQALGVSDLMALELNWRIRNSSVTEFMFTPDRFTLDSFNVISHLNDPELWTHR
jgi:broad specificity phosphatase PhoE